jgi:ribonuclease HI
MTKKIVVIYTDGACSGNPGKGGWGAVLRYGEVTKEIYGGEADTTNNRMELKAAIEALNALNRPSRVELYTDSTYVKNGITEWLENWKKKNWRTSNKKPVKNVDLWQELEAAVSRHEVSWHWVRGHDGNEGNELADDLARKGVGEV